MSEWQKNSERNAADLSNTADERLYWSIADLTQAYRDGQFSPVEIVETALHQLDEWEPKVNAFLSVYADDVLAEAKSAEAAYFAARQGGEAANSLPSLTGVPIALKDLANVRGRRTTSGSRILKDFVPDEDADVWQRIRAAGGLLLGKTNMLEFAYGVPHPDYGQTNNPYDVERTSGGSSGGSAAAVATGIVYGALGTDTGGSIRIPASYCGVVGLKPSYGLVSAKGIFPLSHSLDHVGPLARTAHDAAVFMDAMLGGAPHVRSSQRTGIWGVAGGDQSGEPCVSFAEAVLRPSNVRRVGVLPDLFLRYTQVDVKRAYYRAIQQFEEQGLYVEELPEAALQDLERAEKILMTILLPEASQIHRRWWNRKAEYAELTRQQISAGRKVSAVDYLAALEAQRAYRQTVATWFETFDVIAMPTVDFPAPKEDPAIGDQTMNELRYTGPFNVSGNPAVSVNCGFTREGLPIGLQLVGPHFGDAKLLAFAREFGQMN